MAGGNVIAPFLETDEADDGLYGPEKPPKKDQRSKLVKSKERYAGQIVNACPFGCKDTELDEQMFCRHLVGFTDQDDPTIFYPMEYRQRYDKDGKPLVTKDGKVSKSKRHRFVNGEDPQDVLKGDKLVRVSISHRVYRDVDKKAKE